MVDPSNARPSCGPPRLEADCSSRPKRYSPKRASTARASRTSPRAPDVAVGTIYNYFGDSTELLKALISQRRTDLLTRLDEAMADAKRRRAPGPARSRPSYRSPCSACEITIPSMPFSCNVRTARPLHHSAASAQIFTVALRCSSSGACGWGWCARSTRRSCRRCWSPCAARRCYIYVSSAAPRGPTTSATRCCASSARW